MAEVLGGSRTTQVVKRTAHAAHTQHTARSTAHSTATPTRVVEQQQVVVLEAELLQAARRRLARARDAGCRRRRLGVGLRVVVGALVTRCRRRHRRPPPQRRSHSNSMRTYTSPSRRRSLATAQCASRREHRQAAECRRAGCARALPPPQRAVGADHRGQHFAASFRQLSRSRAVAKAGRECARARTRSRAHSRRLLGIAARWPDTALDYTSMLD